MNNLERITMAIYEKIAISQDDDTADWEFVDNFCGTFNHNIVVASDASLNPTRVDEGKYISAIATVCLCHKDFLISGCCRAIGEETHQKLIKLVDDCWRLTWANQLVGSDRPLAKLGTTTTIN